jgi:hypothetical protein
MNAYNPLDAMKRLEAAGLERRQAEAIAGEINDGTSGLVTKEQLDAPLERTTIRIGILTSGIVAVATTMLGVLISLK